MTRGSGSGTGTAAKNAAASSPAPLRSCTVLILWWCRLWDNGGASSYTGTGNNARTAPVAWAFPNLSAARPSIRGPLWKTKSSLGWTSPAAAGASTRGSIPFLSSPTSAFPFFSCSSSSLTSRRCSAVSGDESPSRDNDSLLAGGIRLNKVLGRTHSRRQADALIAAGRVTVHPRISNPPSEGLSGDPGEIGTAGQRVFPGDVVRLDGIVVDWESLLSLPPLLERAAAGPSETIVDSYSSSDGSNNSESSPTTTESTKTTTSTTTTTVGELLSPPPPLQPTQQSHHHVYLKYWKPVGVTCTCDRRVSGNILDAVGLYNSGPDSDQSSTILHRRIFPVGRLDKDTTGLILLTSDGRLPNAVLQERHQQPKTYKATVDRPIVDSHIQAWRDGVVITTESSSARTTTTSTSTTGGPSPLSSLSSYRRKSITAKTRPAIVQRLGVRELSLTIVEGRNRQVRKMLGTFGYTVLALHRTDFLGLTLEGLEGPGDWKPLAPVELELLQRLMTVRPSETQLGKHTFSTESRHPPLNATGRW